MIRGVKTPAEGTDVKADIINVSSLAAVQPFATWGVYCMGKAARDMAHANVAAEFEADPCPVKVRRNAMIKQRHYNEWFLLAPSAKLCPRPVGYGYAGGNSR